MNEARYREAIDIIEDAMRTEMAETAQKTFYGVWADALSALAGQTDDGATKAGLFEKATEKYAEACSFQPDDHKALFNWGNAISNLALLREGHEREELLGQAAKKFERAVEIKPDEHDVLNNWGATLSNLALMHEGPEREELLERATQKFQRAVEINPDDHETLLSWSNALILLSYLQKGTQRKQMVEAALDKAKRAEKLKPGGGIYNMACCRALLGEKKLALAALKKAVEFHPRFKSMAAKDEDLRTLWEDKTFRAIVNT